MSRQPPEQQAHPAQRVRVRYAKRGRLRFTSHRDFSRAFERAVFRARVPMAYSSGFNPHPRISYAGAAPTGAASEAEFLELALAEVVDPADVLAALDAVMPDGLDVLEAVDAATAPGSSLAERLEGSHWWVDLTADAASYAVGVATFLAAEEVLVQRMTKKGLREFDCRAAVVALEAAPREDGGTRLSLVLRHVVPAVRPDDVVAGVERVGGAAPGGTPLLTRTAQGPLDETTGEVGDPLA